MSQQQLERYLRFVEASPRSDDGYLFDAPRCRFWPEPSDELVVPPGAQLERTPEGACISLAGGARLLLRGLEFEALRGAFALLPCRYSRLLIELGPRTQSFVEQAFSRMLFAPQAVAELEAQLPALEIVRFPGSPYEVTRSYWRNMLVVRRRLEAEPAHTVGELRSLVRELHRLLLLGEDDSVNRSSFYLPASLLGRKRATPGSFYEAPTGVERRGGEIILTSGARVSVPLLGGIHYWKLLAESVSDEGALASERELSVDGVSLGQVVSARAEDEAQSRPWFLPPRPLLDVHFDALLAELAAARAAESARDLPSALAALAGFHYRFVRVHPLPSANQSLAMSFVNAQLSRLLGVGIPHLLLDQLALRFELSAYRRLFARAVSAWNAPLPNAGERLRHLMRLRGELNGFVNELSIMPSLLQARALLPERAHAAELALLSPA